MAEPDSQPAAAAPPVASPVQARGDTTAGELLRVARQQQGMHIAMLAASIKVPQAKLEALEAGRYGELPDASFTRALALSVCRVLKIDAAPVLERLPGAPVSALDKVDGGLNTPFRERPGRMDAVDWPSSSKAVALVVLVLLVASLALWLQPVKVPLWQAEPAPTPSAAPRPLTDAVAGTPAPAEAAVAASTESTTASASAPSAPGVTAAMASSPALPATTTAKAATTTTPATAAPAPVGGDLTIRATQNSWLRVTDHQGQVLLARQVDAGEAVALNGVPPFTLRIGNVRGTEIRYRGAAVDLTNAERANVATLTVP